MCLVLAAILGSYLVRQGQFYLVPVHDIFFYDFFHCADSQSTSGDKEAANAASFGIKAGVTEHGATC
jgi:hypothetical protein